MRSAKTTTGTTAVDQARPDVDAASLRNVRISDSSDGPLVGTDLVRRVMPFILTAVISMVLAIPVLSFNRPWFAVVGLALAVAAIVSSVTVPWNRVPRVAQLASPFLFLAATVLLAAATGIGVGSPFVTMAVLPLMWLAMYENRYAVVVAAVLAGVGLWLSESGSPTSSTIHGTVAIRGVFVVGAVGMGITLHGLVVDTRRIALASRDHQVALENVAEMLDALPERVNRYRLSDLAILYCNAAWATQYGVEPSEALGRPLDEFLSEDELDGLHTQLALLGPDNPILVDTVAREVHKRPPGQWLEWADRYLAGADGPEVLSVGRDVTGRRDAELKLAESEVRFRDLADKSADVVGVSSSSRRRISTTSARRSRASSATPRPTSWKTSAGCWRSSTTKVESPCSEQSKPSRRSSSSTSTCVTPTVRSSSATPEPQRSAAACRVSAAMSRSCAGFRTPWRPSCCATH